MSAATQSPRALRGCPCAQGTSNAISSRRRVGEAYGGARRKDSHKGHALGHSSPRKMCPDIRTNGEGSSNRVSVINTATNTVTTTIPVGHFPLGVAVSPNGAFVYVANSQNIGKRKL